MNAGKKRGVYLVIFKNRFGYIFVCKAGRSIDFDRRLEEHKRKHGEPIVVLFFPTQNEKAVERATLRRFKAEGMELVNGREWFVGNDKRMRKIMEEEIVRIDAEEKAKRIAREKKMKRIAAEKESTMFKRGFLFVAGMIILPLVMGRSG